MYLKILSTDTIFIMNLVSFNRISWILFTLDQVFFVFVCLFFRLGTKLNKQSVGIPTGTNCDPLVSRFAFIL